LNLDDYEAGIYFLKLQGEEFSTLQQFVKVK